MGLGSFGVFKGGCLWGFGVRRWDDAFGVSLSIEWRVSGLRGYVTRLVWDETTRTGYTDSKAWLDDLSAWFARVCLAELPAGQAGSSARQTQVTGCKEEGKQG